MDLAAIALARFVAFFELIDLDPRGRLHYPDFYPSVVQHFNFQQFPRKTEEFDLQKGIELADGKWEKGLISRVVIYGGGIVVETRSSTDDSEKLLDEFLMWAKEKFGLQYYPGMIKRKAYVSSLTFYSDAPLLSPLSSPFSKLAERVTGALGDVLGEKISYEPASLLIHNDQTTRKLSPAAFSIQRRLDIPFTDKKYYSDAPLPTDTHLKILEEFEADILKQTGR